MDVDELRSLARAGALEAEDELDDDPAATPGTEARQTLRNLAKLLGRSVPAVSEALDEARTKLSGEAPAVRGYGAIQIISKIIQATTVAGANGDGGWNFEKWNLDPAGLELEEVTRGPPSGGTLAAPAAIHSYKTPAELVKAAAEVAAATGLGLEEVTRSIKAFSETAPLPPAYEITIDKPKAEFVDDTVKRLVEYFSVVKDK